MTQNTMASEECVHIEREDGEFEDVLIKDLTYVAIDRYGYGRAFSGNEFLGRISEYDVEKVKAKKPEILHQTDYRLSEWCRKAKVTE